MKFSWGNESQADGTEIQYPTEAGYNATRIINLLHTLNRLSPSGARNELAE
jgi:predicted Zn-dependent protease